MVGRIARTLKISPQASSNMRVLLTLAYLTGFEEVVA
jgi:hypothetical protein